MYKVAPATARKDRKKFNSCSTPHPIPWLEFQVRNENFLDAVSKIFNYFKQY